MRREDATSKMPAQLHPRRLCQQSLKGYVPAIHWLLEKNRLQHLDLVQVGGLLRIVPAEGSLPRSNGRSYEQAPHT